MLHLAFRFLGIFVIFEMGVESSTLTKSPFLFNITLLRATVKTKRHPIMELKDIIEIDASVAANFITEISEVTTHTRNKQIINFGRRIVGD